MKFLLGIFITIINLEACSKAKPKAIEPIPNKIDYLIGTWKNVNSKSSDFRLERDSAVFFEDEVPIKYKFELNGDSLMFHFPKFNFGFRLYSFQGDSIQLVNEMNSNTFTRVK